MSQFSTEQDVMKVLRITSKQLRRLRLRNQIPFLQVNRFTRVYDLAAVVAALSVKANGNTENVAEPLETKVKKSRTTTAK